MRDLQQQLDQLVVGLVVEVTAVAAAAATAALARELGESEHVVRARVGRAASSTRIRRTKAALEATRRRLTAFVSSNPGLRIEQINARLGTSTAELALPLKMLIGDGTLRTEGAKRATSYFLA